MTASPESAWRGDWRGGASSGFGLQSEHERLHWFREPANQLEVLTFSECRRDPAVFASAEHRGMQHDVPDLEPPQAADRLRIGKGSKHVQRPDVIDGRVGAIPVDQGLPMER